MGRQGRARGVSVCLISPHPMVLASLEAALRRPGLRATTRRPEPTGRGEWHVPKLPRARVFVLDCHASRPAVQALAQSILSGNPRAALILLAERFTEATAFPLLRAGVRGLLAYADIAGQLERAIDAVGRGSFWVPRAVLGKFVDTILRGPAARSAASAPAELSRREREVMDALLENLANKEIAARLNVSERTVKFHVSRILAKYGVQRRADLILRFYQERAQFA
jgi:DNA-binding NarL/FixJ family response regulator